MKWVFIFLISLHALIHLVGFYKGFRLAPATATTASLVSSRTNTPLSGILWFVVALFLLYAIFLFAFNKSWWLPMMVAIVLSQALIFYFWKEAKWGSVVNIVLLIMAIVSFATIRFEETVKKEIHHLVAPPMATNSTITKEMIATLPAPVKNWLVQSGVVGHAPFEYVHLKQKGWMKMKPGQNNWIPINAAQYFRVSEPAFIWQVKMDLFHFLPIVGCDQFENGKGSMQIKLLSVLHMVKAENNEKLNQGSLQRWLSEICWFPTAALSKYIHWKAIDDSTAVASMTYKGTSGQVKFYFTTDGKVNRITANRFMGSDEKATLQKWEIINSGFATLNGVTIPVYSEARWKLNKGDFTWYKMEIEAIECNQQVIFPD